MEKMERHGGCGVTALVRADGGARCRFVVVARTVAADVVQWCPVAGEIGGGGCVEDGRRGEN
ncbi:hypothetical protein DEO72_LG9g2124 [Vigna unguiculata]|uniref:Uncharacterized protein n=1 Tax=Vigna unguiculata TaxID=3917 RepID=A0A4D6N1F9_VIGUN|nr:hypothetical protein DEO72_LG9g2124 [Vigna unguiculata]